MKAGVTRPVRNVIPLGHPVVLSNSFQTKSELCFSDRARQVTNMTVKVVRVKITTIVRQDLSYSKCLLNLQPTSWIQLVRLMA